MINVNLKEFKKAHKAVSKAASKEASKGTLNGIHFVCNPNTLTLETLDGYRACSYTIKGKWTGSFDIVVPLFNIPTKLNAERIKILCDNETMIIDWGNKAATNLTKINGEPITFEKIEKEVPKGSFEIGFNSTYLKDALEGYDKDTLIKLTLDPNKGQISYLYIEDKNDPSNKRIVLPVRLG